MVYGITMVKVAPGRESLAYQALQSIEGIKEIYCIFGEFSFFLVVEAGDRSRLNRILEDMQMLEEVMELWPVLVSADSQLSDAAFFESLEPAFS